MFSSACPIYYLKYIALAEAKRQNRARREFHVVKVTINEVYQARVK